MPEIQAIFETYQGEELVVSPDADFSHPTAVSAGYGRFGIMIGRLPSPKIYPSAGLIFWLTRNRLWGS
jgi:hypothetical protein